MTRNPQWDQCPAERRHKRWSFCHGKTQRDCLPVLISDIQPPASGGMSFWCLTAWAVVFLLQQPDLLGQPSNWTSRPLWSTLTPSSLPV